MSWLAYFNRHKFLVSIEHINMRSWLLIIIQYQTSGLQYHWEFLINNRIMSLTCPIYEMCTKIEYGMFTTFPQCILNWSFQKYSVKILLCYHLLNVSGNPEIMHCWILIDIPYYLCEPRSNSMQDRYTTSNQYDILFPSDCSQGFYSLLQLALFPQVVRSLCREGQLWLVQYSTVIDKTISHW